MYAKCGVRVGLQWILPTWIGKSSRRVETQGGTPGMLLPPLDLIHVTDYVKKFAGPNDIQMGAQVVAGPTNSVVIDKQGMYWMAGKVYYLSLSISVQSSL